MNWEAISAIVSIVTLIFTIIVEWPRLSSFLGNISNIFVRILLSAFIVGFSGFIVFGAIGAIIGYIIHTYNLDVIVTIGNIFKAEAYGEIDNALTVGLGWAVTGLFLGSLFGVVIGLFYQPKRASL